MTDDQDTGRAAPMAEARRLYCDSTLTVDGIAAATGFSRGAIYRTARRESWPRRRDRLRVAPAGLSPTAGGPLDRRAMATRLERLVASRMAAIESAPATDPVGGERQARTLAHLVRTAATIRTYLGTLKDEEERRDHDAAPPRSLSELRDELRGHLERIREEERRAQLRGDAEPD